MTFSDYIVYVDESGDHGLESIDPEYPLFVLAFCVFEKVDYIEKVVPALQSLKFHYWGHDAIVFHERDFRKGMKGEYGILSNAATRTSLMNDLNNAIMHLPFHTIASVLRKEPLHAKRDESPAHPYHLGLEFCMQSLILFLGTQDVDVARTTTHLVFESRGTQEDNALELEFYRIMQKTSIPKRLFEMRFVSKKANCSGLQLADLTARPIGLHILRPKQPNRAFDIIKPKLFTQNGNYLGYGLTVHP